MNVKPIPEGYQTITPYLTVRNAVKVITFLEHAFGAQELERHTTPDGRVSTSELKIGTSMLMLGEHPDDEKNTPSMLYLYVEDADKFFKKAVEAGGKVVMEVTDQFYGDRSGAVEDPSGNQWWIATRKENLSSEEIAKRAGEIKG